MRMLRFYVRFNKIRTDVCFTECDEELHCGPGCAVRPDEERCNTCVCPPETDVEDIPITGTLDCSVSGINLVFSLKSDRSNIYCVMRILE